MPPQRVHSSLDIALLTPHQHGVDQAKRVGWTGILREQRHGHLKMRDTVTDVHLPKRRTPKINKHRI